MADPEPQRGWSIETYAAHNEALREAQAKFETERDRRYTEVGVEREKALKIKETADLAALGLAREIQTYKDEKANELREQINSERGLYATKGDLAAVVDKFEALDRSRTHEGRQQSQWTTERVISLLIVALGVLYFVLNYTKVA